MVEVRERYRPKLVHGRCIPDESFLAQVSPLLGHAMQLAGDQLISMQIIRLEDRAKATRRDQVEEDEPLLQEEVMFEC